MNNKQVSKHRLKASHLYQLKQLSNVQLSPNGQHIVFCQQQINAKTQKKTSHLWVADTKTLNLKQFNYGAYLNTRPQWSPDGSKIAFISNRTDEKQPQIYIIPLNGGEARPLTTLTADIGHFAWSPDAKQLVCSLRQKDETMLELERDEQKKTLGVVDRRITQLVYKENGLGFLPQAPWQLWLIDTTTGQSNPLTEKSIYHEHTPAWSPDGSQIVFCSNRSPNPELNWYLVDLFIISVNGGPLKKLNTSPGPKDLPTFSPDGQWIAYYGGHQQRWQNHNLWIVPAYGQGQAKNLTAQFDYHIGHATRSDVSTMTTSPPVWSADSQQIYVQVTHHGHTTLNAINRNTATLAPIISTRELNHTLDVVNYTKGEIDYTKSVVDEFSFNQNSTKVAYLQSTLADPGQIWVQTLPVTAAAQQITYVNQSWLKALNLGNIEEVWFKGKDNNKLQGWILTPPNFDPTQQYASILQIHGGPHEQYGHTFMFEFYYLAAQNYIVYFCNPRGGRGYGEDHTKAIYNQWGSADYDDLMTWTDLISQKPYVDSTKLGVTGGSYGGYLTNWIIGHTPRFKAAVTQRSISNMISMTAVSDFNYYFTNLFGGDKPFWEDFENYWHQSPLKYVANIQTPTLIIHSEQDYRCNLIEGEQLFTALKRLDIPTELIIFPNESHGLSRTGRIDRRIARLKHILRWFKRFL